jgi:hypothetical protein
MAKTLLLAWSTPASEETDAEFNRWYTETHVPELRAAIPSITSVNRYRLTPELGAAVPAAGRYLAVYELDSDDAGEAAAQLIEATGGGKVSAPVGMDTAGNAPAIELYQHL